MIEASPENKSFDQSGFDEINEMIKPVEIKVSKVSLKRLQLVNEAAQLSNIKIEEYDHFDIEKPIVMSLKLISEDRSKPEGENKNSSLLSIHQRNGQYSLEYCVLNPKEPNRIKIASVLGNIFSEQIKNIEEAFIKFDDSKRKNRGNEFIKSIAENTEFIKGTNNE